MPPKFSQRKSELGASLECGGLAPFCYRSRPINTKAASSRRTPGRRLIQRGFTTVKGLFILSAS